MQSNGTNQSCWQELDSYNIDAENIYFIDATSDSNFENVKRYMSACPDDDALRKMLTFQDIDCNTGLHFGARNGNYKIVNLIIDEAIRVDCTLHEGL